MSQFSQYNDLPQINLAQDSLLNVSLERDDYHFGPWGSGYANHMPYQKSSGVRMVKIFGQDIAVDECQSPNGLNMRPMQRFLDGPDCSPLAQGLLHAKFNNGATYHDQHLRPAELPWPAPASYLREVSPGTSSSESSGLPTSMSQCSPHIQHFSYNTHEVLPQTTFSYSHTPHFGGGGGGTYTTPPTTPQNITLREIEYTHVDAEPLPAEHDYTDMEPDVGYVNEQEHAYIKPEVHERTYEAPPNSSTGPPAYFQRVPESVHPASPSSSSPAPQVSPDAETSDSDYKPCAQRTTRKRRQSSLSGGSTRPRQRRATLDRKASTTSVRSNKVTKKSRAGSASQASSGKGLSNHGAPDQRPFPCPLAVYGCQSTFVSKNEWKRHVSTQHIKLGFWRCRLCPTTVDNHDPSTIYHNDFNRKDLFTQHLRRMHAAPAHQTTSSRKQTVYPVNDDNVAQHQTDCYEKLRSSPPRSCCLFCDHTFAGPGSWDERMEHVGRHLEKDRNLDVANPQQWRRDTALRDWLLKEGLIASDRNGMLTLAAADGKPRRDSLRGDSDDD